MPHALQVLERERRRSTAFPGSKLGGGAAEGDHHAEEKQRKPRHQAVISCAVIAYFRLSGSSWSRISPSASALVYMR